MVTGLLGASAVGALGLAFLAARQRRIEALDAELRRPIEVDEANREKLTEEFPWLDVAATGAFTLYDAFHSLAMLDDHVLEALEFSSAANLHTFNSLSSYVHKYFLSHAGEALQGSLERLQGYTAERIVAAHLAAEGYVVEFPDISNQEGWDLLVDGHSMQVKGPL